MDGTGGSCDTLLVGGAVVTMDDDERVIDPGAVAIAGERIVAVGTEEELSGWRAGEVIDCRKRAIVPGFVDCHNHLFQTLARGLGEGLALWPWLCEFMWPYAGAARRADAVAGATLGAIEAVCAGTTCIVDNHYSPSDAETTLAVAQAVEDVGLRGAIARGIFGEITDVASEHGLSPALFRHTADEELAITEDCMRARAGRRVTVWPAPINIIYVEQELVARSVELARSHDSRWHCHCSEARVDPEIYLEAYGARPLRWLCDEGLLDERATIAHAIWLDDDEVRIAADTGAAIAYNPGSNMYLASGPLPLRALRSAGAVVGLGSDGAACGHTLDMLEAMSEAVYVQRLATLDPLASGASEALALATREAARFAGVDAGQLVPGKLADLVVIELARPHLTPLHDVVTTVVYAAKPSDVALTMVGGQVVARDGEPTLVSAADAMAEGQARAEELAARATLV